MNRIELDQKLQRVQVKPFEIDNKVIFSYFDNLPVGERDEKIFKAIYIGVLALMEDRFSAFLSKTSNQLGTELESLKMIFDMKNEIFNRSAAKGVMAEEEVASFLTEYFKTKKINDKVIMLGNSAGAISKNKTGDIICELNGNPELKIVIECKFDKSMKLGDIESKEIFTRKSDTAWSQLIEAQANREARVSLIVFDVSTTDNSILKSIDNLAYLQGIGFIVIVDSQKGDYSNLSIAYMLARDIALNSKIVELDRDLLQILINRMIKDLNGVLTIKNMVEANIQNNREILKQLEKSTLLMKFNRDYFKKFLAEGTLTKKDLLDFYFGEDVREEFKSIEKEIEKL